MLSPTSYFSAPGLGSNATVTVNNSGSILTYGNYSAAIVAGITFGAADPSITINNAKTGVIIAHGYPYHAVVAFGAPTTINNDGFIQGNVQLTAFADTFNNNKGGTWVMKGDSNFGAGNDVVNNGGVVRVLNNLGPYSKAGIQNGRLPLCGCRHRRHGQFERAADYRVQVPYHTVQGLENWNNFSSGAA